MKGRREKELHVCLVFMCIHALIRVSTNIFLSKFSSSTPPPFEKFLDPRLTTSSLRQYLITYPQWRIQKMGLLGLRPLCEKKAKEKKKTHNNGFFFFSFAFYPVKEKQISISGKSTQSIKTILHHKYNISLLNSCGAPG